MTDAERLATLLAALVDETYPCPCWDDETDAACPNRVTYSWEHEYGEFGSVLSSWPEFDGCDVHEERLNEGTPGDYCIERVLGMASERKRLREVAGLVRVGEVTR